jgi:hypothetical protein
METVHLRRSDPTVDELIRAAFPGLTCHKVEAIVTESVRFYGTNWDEGNRREYVIARLADKQIFRIEDAPFMERSELHEKIYKLPPGFVVVVHVIGRYEHIEIHTAADNVTRLLPAPVTRSEDEEIVLVATCSLKASYGGVSNYRFVEAKRYTGIDLHRWETAKSTLIAKKLLNKAGAATPEGRNARPEWGSAGIGLHGYQQRRQSLEVTSAQA